MGEGEAGVAHEFFLITMIGGQITSYPFFLFYALSLILPNELPIYKSGRFAADS